MKISLISILALPTSFAAAVPSNANVNKRGLCGARGYDRGKLTAYFYSSSANVRTLEGCANHCTADSSCVIYAFGRGLCLHYATTLYANNPFQTTNLTYSREDNFKEDDESSFTFYDRSCTDSSAPISSKRASTRYPKTTNTSPRVQKPTTTRTSNTPSGHPRPGGSCGVVGYDKGKEAFMYKKSSRYRSFDGCKTLCETKNGCLSFAFGSDGCYIYRYAVAENFEYSTDSPYVFYDVGCEDVIVSSLQSLYSTGASTDTALSSILRSTPPSTIIEPSSIYTLVSESTANSISSTAFPQSSQTESITTLSALASESTISTLTGSTVVSTSILSSELITATPDPTSTLLSSFASDVPTSSSVSSPAPVNTPAARCRCTGQLVKLTVALSDTASLQTISMHWKRGVCYGLGKFGGWACSLDIPGQVYYVNSTRNIFDESLDNFDYKLIIDSAGNQPEVNGSIPVTDVDELKWRLLNLEVDKSSNKLDRISLLIKDYGEE